MHTDMLMNAGTDMGAWSLDLSQLKLSELECYIKNIGCILCQMDNV